MSHSVDALWKSVVKQLQQLSATGPEQQGDAFSTINRDIDALFNKKSLPRATWKHLIRELKVSGGSQCCCGSAAHSEVGLMHRKRVRQGIYCVDKHRSE